MFYKYSQNNSGGSFDIDDTLTIVMIFEADSSSEADNLAIEKGIYFNGCEEGLDCDCCGDRWYDANYCEELSENDIEGTYSKRWVEKGQAYCRVFMKDGTVKEYCKED